jgi:hypothetical protein
VSYKVLNWARMDTRINKVMSNQEWLQAIDEEACHNLYVWMESC